jgi:hypothetical protein
LIMFDLTAGSRLVGFYLNYDTNVKGLVMVISTTDKNNNPVVSYSIKITYYLSNTTNKI